MPSRVLVGIPSYNDREYIHMVLQSIRWYTDLDEPYDVVVCDDGSRPDVVADIEKICQHFGVYFIKHEKNEGIPATWNHLGMALGGQSEIIVWLNDDILVVPQWLRCVTYFLDANKDVPTLGTVSLQPRHVPRHVAKDWFRLMLPDLGHTVFRFDGLLDGRESCHEAINAHDPLLRGKVLDVRDGEGQGLGRVMCPCGCSFAMLRREFETQPFDENIMSFHEESDKGTQLASIGRASYCLAYPRPYHVISGTFMNNPELQHNHRMHASRKYYRQKWGVPDSEPESGFDWVNAKYMPHIPHVKMKFLAPDYSLPPTERKLPGGETVLLPALVEREQEV